MEETKICNVCGKEKPSTTEYFPPRKESLDGLRNECKECKNSYNKKWKLKNKERLDKKYGKIRKEYLKIYYQENKEYHNRQTKRYYEENKDHLNKLSKINYYENREYYNQLGRENYQINRERELLNKQEYYKKNKDRIKKYNKYYSKNNLEAIRTCTNRRKSRENNLPSTFTIEEWEECKSYFDYECAYCGKKRKLEQEHFVPVSKGGGYTQDNIIPACSKCNNNKRAKVFEDWYSEKEFYSKEREDKIFEYLNSISKFQQISTF